MKSTEELLREQLLRNKRDRLIAEAVVKGAANGVVKGTFWAIGIIFFVLFMLLIIGK